MIFTGRTFEKASEETARGAYVAWLLNRRSAADIHGWARMIGVSNLVDPEEMHCTVAYDREHALAFDWHGDWPLPSPMELGSYNRPFTRILGAAGSPGALVTTYDSDRLAARHRFFRDEMGLEYSFPIFIPHVTLSYDASSQCPEVLRRITETPCRLPVHFDRERVTYCGSGS